MSEPDFTSSFTDRNDDMNVITFMSSHLITGLAVIGGTTKAVVSLLDDAAESWLSIDLDGAKTRTLSTELAVLADLLDAGYQLPPKGTQ